MAVISEEMVHGLVDSCWSVFVTCHSASADQLRHHIPTLSGFLSIKPSPYPCYDRLRDSYISIILLWLAMIMTIWLYIL